MYFANCWKTLHIWNVSIYSSVWFDVSLGLTRVLSFEFLSCLFVLFVDEWSWSFNCKTLHWK